MGTIAELFESGERRSDKGHFKNLVLLARADGKVEEVELQLLKRIASRLSLTEEQVKEIIEHPSQYPTIPPVSKVERYERLAWFVEMIYVDGIVDAEEERLVLRKGVALGFDEKDIERIYHAILAEVKAGKSLQDIVEKLA